MAKHNKTAKVNIPMCIATLLFCLTLVSVHFTSGLYAKYSVSDSGSDSAGVISFGDLTLSESGDFYENNSLMIIPGVNLTKKATVDFAGSESATYVFVEIVPSDGWQETYGYTFSYISNDKIAMQWSVNEYWELLTDENGIYVYYRALVPNTALEGVDIIADNGRIFVSDQISKSELGSMVNISIKLRAAVVQAGGFANPEAAWNSVAAKEG